MVRFGPEEERDGSRRLSISRDIVTDDILRLARFQTKLVTKQARNEHVREGRSHASDALLERCQIGSCSGDLYQTHSANLESGL